MKHTEKLRIIRNNLEDGLSVPFKPFDDNDAITDLRVKLNMFDFALKGLKDKSSHSIIEHEDMINLAHYWINIFINLEQVLSLLEYVKYALDPREDVVELDDERHYQFPITRVKGAIERYREENASLIQIWEKEGARGYPSNDDTEEDLVKSFLDSLKELKRTNPDRADAYFNRLLNLYEENTAEST